MHSGFMSALLSQTVYQIATLVGKIPALLSRHARCYAAVFILDCSGTDPSLVASHRVTHNVLWLTVCNSVISYPVYIVGQMWPSEKKKRAKDSLFIKMSFRYCIPMLHAVLFCQYAGFDKTHWYFSHWSCHQDMSVLGIPPHTYSGH